MLHIHSNFSLLSGASSIDSILQKAKQYNVRQLALTDINGMYGLIQFYKKAIEEGIKPVLGVYLTDPKSSKNYVILLARNYEGYSKICKYITYRKLNEEFSFEKLLSKNDEDIFVITPWIELLGQLKGNENLFAEIIITTSKKNKSLEVYNYARENGIKITASSPVWFVEKEDFLIHKVLKSIDNNNTLENADPEELTDEEYYFISEEEINSKFSRIPDALINLYYILENCNVDLKLNQNKLPRFSIEGENSYDKLREIVYRGLEERYKPLTRQCVERMDYELSVIDELNFNDYFLIVWDIVREAKRRRMMIIGRGSAANSLVAYCLGITQIDPIQSKLYFERFLNSGRSSPPDIDIDFSWRERDEIIKYVFEKYGYERTAMICTTVTFKARSAFREVAKTFGLSNEEISKHSKFIPWTNAANLENIHERFPESKKLNFSTEPWKSIVKIASKIANFPRHLSIHPSGIIITPEPITHYVALEYAKNKGFGLIITQPDMYSIEEMGLVKIDLLSQRALGVLRDTMNKLK